MITRSKTYNENYAAKIVKINNLRKHNNADRLQVSTVDGNNVIVGLDTKIGDVVLFFPIESAINKEFLSWSNSFQDADLNQNKEKKGFFEKNGRVRCLKLRGERSEGYCISVNQLENWLCEKIWHRASLSECVNQEFDTIYGILLCEKYVSRVNKYSNVQGTGKKAVKPKRFDRLVENQFRFHIDTVHLGKNLHRINANDVISISKKLHGTSFIVSRLLTRKKLKWYEKCLKAVSVQIVNTHYDMLYASRKVLKNRYIRKERNNQNHFYSYDLWSDIAEELQPYLVDGMSIYGECVGFTKTGKYIQKGYDYGCDQSRGEHRLYIYRITYTTPDGHVFELSYVQIADFCKKYRLLVVPMLYWGYAKDLFDQSKDESSWEDFLMKKLSDTFLEKDCDMCVNKVPAEGIVVRPERGEFEAYKLKSFRFKEVETKMLDAGEENMEDNQVEEI